jgi:hypothetical protein
MITNRAIVARLLSGPDLRHSSLSENISEGTPNNCIQKLKSKVTP